MGGAISQMLPPSPAFTEKELPSLKGKIFIVTGGNSGVGLALVKLLYAKGATVYIAGSSSTLIDEQISALESLSIPTPGYAKSLLVDLSDLTMIPSCVSTLLAQESRLDVLWNNFGIAQVPADSVSVQGHEAHMGTNCLGAYLLAELLLPILLRTAKSSPRASVRVVFVSSGVIDMVGPPVGVSLAEQVPGNYNRDPARNYSASKARNWLFASELDRRTREAGMVCTAVNPGMLQTMG